MRRLLSCLPSIVLSQNRNNVMTTQVVLESSSSRWAAGVVYYIYRVYDHAN